MELVFPIQVIYKLSLDGIKMAAEGSSQSNLNPFLGYELHLGILHSN